MRQRVMMRFFVAVVFAVMGSSGARGEVVPMVEVVRLVAATPAEVWRAWTTAEGFGEVFDGPVLHAAELRVGGAYEIYWSPGSPEGERGSEGCRVLSYVPERMLSFSWNAPPQFGALRGEMTHVVVELEALGPGMTRMTVRHLGFGEGEAWAGVRAYFAEAWVWVADQVTAGLGGVTKAPTGYVMFLRPAREGFFTAPTAEEGARVGEHFARLARLTREGVVIFAGPCTDRVGPGIVVFEASGAAEAERMMREDPAVASGVFTAEVHPVAFSLLRERDRV